MYKIKKEGPFRFSVYISLYSSWIRERGVIGVDLLLDRSGGLQIPQIVSTQA